MSSFSRFQKINQSRGTAANRKTNASFVMSGYPSIFITGTDGSEIQACVVNKQEKDMAYIYTQNVEQINDVLPIGSTWGAKGLHWLITEEIITIKDVGWHKYLAILCNVEIDGQWGYFISAEASYVNTVLREEVLLQTQQKPLLILANSNLKINDKIMIKNRAWQIQEEDNLSTPGISYFSLIGTTMSKEIINAEENKDKDFIIEHEPVIDADAHLPQEDQASLAVVEESDIIWVDPLQEIEIPTIYAYAVFSNSKIKIHKLSNKLVKFSFPFGVTETDVKVKDEKNNIIIYHYKARV